MLSHLLVVELSSVLAGPLVGQFLAELGARVIKVENSATHGDGTRTWKLPTEDESDDRSAYFLSANACKESIALDLRREQDLNLCHAMIAKADILIHNYKSGDAERFHLRYEACKKMNPRLIYANISGYGEDDRRVGYDAVIQAQSGFMAINGEPQTQPTKLPVALIDVLAAQQLRQAILLALLHREKSGEGSHVHCSLFKTALSALVNQASNALNAGFEPRQSGSDHPNIAPYGTLYLSSDNKWILLAVGTDTQFCSLLDVLHLSAQESFATNQLRVKHRRELHELLSTAIAQWEAADLEEACLQRAIPVAIVHGVREAFAMPEAQEMLMHCDGVIGLRSIAFDASFFAPIAGTAAPHLNQDEKRIRAEFGSAS